MDSTIGVPVRAAKGSKGGGRAIVPGNDVPRATMPLAQRSYAEAVAAAVGGVTPIEAYSRDTTPLLDLRRLHGTQVPSAHPFVYAAEAAYAGHYPLVLSPDMLWLLIVQGFAIHVNANQEALRDRLVTHAGKLKLVVEEDDLVRGFAGNDWEWVIREFCERIAAHTGPRLHGAVCRHFSTTGLAERAAFEVTLMDAMQAYFDYDLLHICGIPEFALEGTFDDWKAVRDGAAALSEFDLEWWMEHLLPVLDQFVRAADGDVDREFWQGFYKMGFLTCGNPLITGHLTDLFPYRVRSAEPAASKDRDVAFEMRRGASPQEAEARWEAAQVRYGTGVPQRNTELGRRSQKVTVQRLLGTGGTFNVERTEPKGIGPSNVPSALSVAPFTWRYGPSSIPMEFLAGFVGVSQDAETLALRPEIGWAVRERVS